MTSWFLVELHAHVVVLIILISMIDLFLVREKLKKHPWNSFSALRKKYS